MTVAFSCLDFSRARLWSGLDISSVSSPEAWLLLSQQWDPSAQFTLPRPVEISSTTPAEMPGEWGIWRQEMYCSVQRCFVCCFYFLNNKDVIWLELSQNIWFRLSILEKSPHLHKIVVFLVEKFSQTCIEHPTSDTQTPRLAPVADPWLLTLQTQQSSTSLG